MSSALQVALRLGTAEGGPQRNIEAEAKGDDGVQETPERGVLVGEHGSGSGRGSAGRTGGVGESVEARTGAGARWEGEAACSWHPAWVDAIGAAENGPEHAEHGIVSGVGAGVGLVKAEYLADLSFGHVRAGHRTRSAGTGNPLGVLWGVEVRSNRDIHLRGVCMALSRGSRF